MELENTPEVANQPTTVEARAFAPTSADTDYADRLKQMDSLTASNSIASPDVQNMLNGFNVSLPDHDAPNGPSGSGDNGHRDLVPSGNHRPGGGGDGGQNGGGGQKGGGGQDTVGGGDGNPTSGTEVTDTTGSTMQPKNSPPEAGDRPMPKGKDKPLTARSVSEQDPSEMVLDKPISAQEPNSSTATDISATKDSPPPATNQNDTPPQNSQHALRKQLDLLKRTSGTMDISQGVLSGAAKSIATPPDAMLTTEPPASPRNLPDERPDQAPPGDDKPVNRIFGDQLSNAAKDKPIPHKETRSPAAPDIATDKSTGHVAVQPGQDRPASPGAKSEFRPLSRPQQSEIISTGVNDASQPASNGSGEQYDSAASVQQALDKLLEVINRRTKW